MRTTVINLYYLAEEIANAVMSTALPLNKSLISEQEYDTKMSFLDIENLLYTTGRAELPDKVRELDVLTEFMKNKKIFGIKILEVKYNYSPQKPMQNP